jgi:hypothetical protein
MPVVAAAPFLPAGGPVRGTTRISPRWPGVNIKREKIFMRFISRQAPREMYAQRA